jgi:hypothetical protein
MGKGKEILKFDGREKIKPCTECTYLGTKMDQLGNNTTEIKHRISQTRKAINVLNSIQQKYYYKQKIIYLSNHNSEHFDAWCKNMANSYQRNK